MDRGMTMRAGILIGLSAAALAGAAIDAQGALLMPDAAVMGPAIPSGEYRCRIVKLGMKSPGMLPYVAYPPFACRVQPMQGLQQFAKLTGSQRPVGLLFPGDQLRSIFLGTLVLGVVTPLTAFAVLIAVLAYASVGLAVDGVLPSGTLGYGAGLGGLFLVIIRRLDFAAVETAVQRGRDVPGAEAPRQLIWTAVGVVAFAAVLIIVRDHTTLQRYTYTAAAAGLVLLLLPALPVLGQTINGARLWIRFAGFTVQPSEAAKLLLILFFAGYLVAKRDVLSLASRRVLGLDLPRGRDLGPVLVAWGASLAVLIRGKDLGSSLLFFALFVVMLYVATERTSWLVIGVLLFRPQGLVVLRSMAVRV